jgi:tRNA (cytidine/uridine-2'-O-)-methyltransferase
VKIILYQPQIPQNTGNIVRTCSVTGTDLMLVPPFGFSISDRWLKRAGLDYWEGVNVTTLENLEEYLENLEANFYFFSSHAKKHHTDVTYDKNSHLIFGSETSGLPDVFLKRYPERFVKIPMLQDTRCLNLATSVGIGLFEAIRQTGNLQK